MISESRNIAEIRRREGAVAHQCNCVTRGRAAGVARTIFSAFTYSDIYKNRTLDDLPGTCRVAMPPPGVVGKPIVCNLLSQFFPGAADGDEADKRLGWLDSSIKQMLSHPVVRHERVFFIPYRMGCCLGGGDWDEVRQILLANEKNGIEFVCCVW